VRYKAAQRAEELGHRKSSQDYDLITGQPLVSRVGALTRLTYCTGARHVTHHI
jgi:hypothetical protein